MWYDATTWRGNYWMVLLTKRRGWAWKRHNLASQALTLCKCYHLQDLLVNLPLLAPWLSLHPALQSTHFAQVPAPPVLASPSRTFTAVCGWKGFMALLAWATGRKVHPFSSHQEIVCTQKGLDWHKKIVFLWKLASSTKKICPVPNVLTVYAYRKLLLYRNLLLYRKLLLYCGYKYLHSQHSFPAGKPPNFPWAKGGLAKAETSSKTVQKCFVTFLAPPRWHSEPAQAYSGTCWITALLHLWQGTYIQPKMCKDVSISFIKLQLMQ